MKATGVVRKTDELGRLVIPKNMREQIGIEVGTSMEFFIDEKNQLVIRKYISSNCCSECGQSRDDLVGKTRICKPCAIKLSQSLL
jgi:transcriptional pleiotropic regulator of transition state genes